MKRIMHVGIFAVALGLQAVSASELFREQLIDDKVEIGYGVAIGDVDGDGKPDILLADKKQFVWYRNPDWQKFVMQENLTFRDNVCIAAQDLDGDGKVEVAVGAQWNPGNTTDTEESGSIHYLIRPEDPTQTWTGVALPHEPTIHRMRWAKVNERWQLVVLPLHGRGNKKGAGVGVKILAYAMPENPAKDDWPMTLLDDTLHKTHNLDVVGARVVIAGAEGVKMVQPSNTLLPLPGCVGAGEVRLFSLGGARDQVATVEPLHGTDLVVYVKAGADKPYTRKVLNSSLNQGHSIVATDFLGLGWDQVAVGWRNLNKHRAYGIKLYAPKDATGAEWTEHWVDENGMACENMQQADLDGDGVAEIIAAGRVSKNLKVYWVK